MTWTAISKSSMIFWFEPSRTGTFRWKSSGLCVHWRCG